MVPIYDSIEGLSRKEISSTCFYMLVAIFFYAFTAEEIVGDMPW